MSIRDSDHPTRPPRPVTITYSGACEVPATTWDSIDGVLQITTDVIEIGLNPSVFLFEAASPHVIASAPDEATAYPHRGKMITNAIIQVTWGDESLNEVADAWRRETRDLLVRPEDSGYGRSHVYINYTNRDEPLQALYGYEEWRWERLTSLKREYDLEWYFDGYHGIPKVFEGWYALGKMWEQGMGGRSPSLCLMRSCR
ncbi:hypothetical protein NEUTE2DRAFT_161301 [Neurospora tetrasperma FGSC 2509]|nr:hypothetical protein NEUTE2DRAFT_161301 [Neurospora tetrasperma FGSC 2509]